MEPAASPPAARRPELKPVRKPSYFSKCHNYLSEKMTVYLVQLTLASVQY